MWTAVAVAFALSIAAPWLHRLAGRGSGWLLATAALGLTAYVASLGAGILAGGEPLVESRVWFESLGIRLALRLDGLAYLFALLVTGIGTLVVLYAGAYLEGHPQLGRFYAFLFLFLAAMLGLVLADDLVLLFVFWELTSLSSYFLIGFEHEHAVARRAALQALLVTGVGGLALLAAAVLLGEAGGTYLAGELAADPSRVHGHAMYGPIVALVLVAAFTKSAQVPFHFWLPGAMAAPAPVSAYLHSSTMVKAGVYLVARLDPVLGGTWNWQVPLVLVGGTTLVVGAAIAMGQTHFKRLLAYSTVSALGLLVLLLGLGTPRAVEAAMLLLVAHAFYKGALFLAAGVVARGTKESDAENVRGLGRRMPAVAVALALAAVSMMGLPPSLGFVAKESILEAALTAPFAPAWVLAAAAAGLVLLVAVALTVGLAPLLPGRDPARPEPRKVPLALSAGPILLAGLGLAVGLDPALVAGPVLSAAATSISPEATFGGLALWHGTGPPFWIGLAILAGGIGLFAARSPLRRAARGPSALLASAGPERGYERSMSALAAVARWQSATLQSGYLRSYLLLVLVAAGAVVGWRMVLFGAGAVPGRLELTTPRVHEVLLAVAMLAAALAAARAKSRIAAIAAMGVVGYGMALVFVLHGAPDLAMTQFVVETLTVLLFVYAFQALPRFANPSSVRVRVRDAIVGLLAAALVTALVLSAYRESERPSISGWYVERSVPEGHGRNVVNVILVDFRALDTMGEITVLAVAGLGVFALLRGVPLRRGRDR